MLESFPLSKYGEDGRPLFEKREITAYFVRGIAPGDPWQRFDSKAEAVKALRTPDTDPRWRKGFHPWKGTVHPHEAKNLNLP